MDSLDTLWNSTFAVTNLNHSLLKPSRTSMYVEVQRSESLQLSQHKRVSRDIYYHLTLPNCYKIA